MASASTNGKLVGVAAIAAFIAGCWMGMGSGSSGGDVYCVVTSASAAGRPGYAPGQLVERETLECQPGEPQVCGHFTPETGDDREFESDTCPDD